MRFPVLLFTWLVAGIALARAQDVVGSDATATFLPLGLSKGVAIDLPRDVHDVLVVNKDVVNAVVRSKRRVYIIGTNLGQSNIFFFDAEGQPISGVNVVVTSGPQPAEDQFVSPAQVVTVYRSDTPTRYTCNRSTCVQTVTGR